MIKGFGAKKKQKRKEKRTEFPFKRIPAKIKLDSSGAVIESRVILSDFSATGLGCFVEDPVALKEQVSVVMDYPRSVFLRGEVVWCKPFKLDTKVLSQEDYRYRIGILFVFDGPEEKEAVKKLYEEISKLS